MIRFAIIFLIFTSIAHSMSKEDLQKAVERSWKEIPQLTDNVEMLIGTPADKQKTLLAKKKEAFEAAIKAALKYSQDAVEGKVIASKDVQLQALALVMYYESAMNFFKEPNIMNKSVLDMQYHLIPMLEKLEEMNLEDIQKKYKEMESIKNIKPDMVIKVLGRQWDWIFTYPDGSQISGHKSKRVNETGSLSWGPLKFDKDLKAEKMEKQIVRFATVPIKKTILLEMTAEKVKHAFAIPAFRMKKDLVPNQTAKIWFKPIKEGTYIYTCNEMCGMDHGSMIGYLRVVSEEEFKKFEAALKSQKPKVKIPKDKSPTPAGP